MMKDNMLSFALLGFLLSWMLPADSKVIPFNFSRTDSSPIALDLVKDAIDDMYEGCSTNMMNKVKSYYMKKENVGQFADVWKKSKTCAERGLKKRGKEDAALTKDLLQAICVYTVGKEFYQYFNSAVRTSRKEYNTSFKFHSLHFLLTFAVQTLRRIQNYCVIAYRRTDIVFTGKVNQIIRFGYFTSSSSLTNLTRFGTKTCFEIRTCHGAYLKEYPHLGDHEKEVLIPPYEMFKITKITKGPQLKYPKGLDDCKVVFSLKTIGLLSNLNCQAA